MDLKPIEKLRPFQKFCITIGELPVSYLESMTYLELLYWFINFLQEQVIPTVNNNAQAVEELQTLFVELQNYVDEYQAALSKDFNDLKNWTEDYLENLDVQQEIDNKLDELVTDGTLSTLLQEYLKYYKIYNTHSDLLNDTTILPNMNLKILGYYNINDGGETSYFSSELPIEGCYSEKLNDNLYINIISDSIDIRQLGAKGDSIMDCTNIITKAIEYFNEIYIKNGNYLISSTIPILSNRKIIGDNSKLIKQTAGSFFSANGTSNDSTIYNYTITGTEVSNTFFWFDNNKIYEVTIPQKLIVENNILVINQLYQSATVIAKNLTNTPEIEFEVNEVNSSGGYNITNLLSASTRNIPTEFTENIIIDGINAENKYTNQNLYLLRCSNVKNICVKNCYVEKMGLFYSTLTTSNIPESTTNDNYVLYGYCDKILNDNINILNNSVIGQDVKGDFSSITTTSSCVYLGFTKNSIVSNNTLKNLQHGISLWGGNVGGTFTRYPLGAKFIKNIICDNNIINCVKMGGIWTSRGTNLILANNVVENGGDVGLDFEGCNNSTADSNTCNNFINGCLSIFYSSTNCTFSNNICKIDKSNIVRFIYVVDINAQHYCNIKFVNNTFNSIYEMKGFSNTPSNPHYEIEFCNNICNNFYFYFTGTQNPPLNIYNNIFTVNKNVANSENEIHIIELRPLDVYCCAKIKNNIFKIINPSTENFDNIIPIYFSGSRWRNAITFLIENNEFYKFTTPIKLNHIRSGGNESTLYAHIHNNKFTGDIVNTSDGGCIMDLFNNKKINSDTLNQTNYPNAIPAQNETGYKYKSGSRIFFDTPDGDSYTEAICTTTGNPGTWKRCNKTE